MRACIRTDLDCADVCATTARMLARTGTGPVVLAQLAACVEACRACAVECERHAGHHEHCRECAAACRVCADACEELLTVLGGAQP